MEEAKRESKYVAINMYLDFTNFPTVAGVLEDLLETNQFGDFVYFAIEHMLKNSEEYGSQQQQQLLDSIYETIGALNGTVEDMSSNVLDLIDEVGVHSTLLQKGIKKDDLEQMLKSSDLRIKVQEEQREKRVENTKEEVVNLFPKMELPNLEIEEEVVSESQSSGTILLQDGDEDLFDF